MEIVVLLPSGLLVASGCVVYFYTRYRYGRPNPMFDDFASLKAHLRSDISLNSKSHVVVEGTLTQYSQQQLSQTSQDSLLTDSEKNAINSPKGNKLSNESSHSYFLTDSNGVSITVTSLQKFTHLFAKTGKNLTKVSHSHDVHDNQLAILGYASFHNDEIRLTPLQYDKSMSAIVFHRKSRKWLLYAGSCLLIVSGCVVFNFVFSFILPIIRAYKFLRFSLQWIRK